MTSISLSLYIYIRNQLIKIDTVRKEKLISNMCWISTVDIKILLIKIIYKYFYKDFFKIYSDVDEFLYLTNINLQLRKEIYNSYNLLFFLKHN